MDRDPGPAQVEAEQPRGDECGARRLVAPCPPPVDDQRRERGRLVQVELGLPAETRAARVEPALVAEDPAAHVPDSRRGHLPRERAEPCGRQRRIAVPLEHEVPLPRRSALPSFAEHVGFDAERGPERGQGRIRRGELLVRRGAEREPCVVREERAAGAEVEDDRARARRAHVRCVQRPASRWGNAPLEPACAAGTRRNAMIAAAATARRRDTAFPFFKREAKRQAAWVDPPAKMGRAAHSRGRGAVR